METGVQGLAGRKLTGLCCG